MTAIPHGIDSPTATFISSSVHPCLRVVDHFADDGGSPPAAISETRYRNLFENAISAVLFTRPDGRIVDVNAAALELFGMTEETMFGHRAHDLYANPDERDRAVAQLEVLGARRDFETWFRRQDGTVFRASLNSWVHRNAAGEIVGYWAIVRDVTERRSAQARQSLLLRELDHRVRNNLAAVIGIARLTAQSVDSLDSFLDRFLDRIDSMRVAHELLGTTSWNGAELSELVRRLLQPCQLDQDARITVSGPRCELPSHLACPLSMVIAEMVTNAVKYGALSVPEGSVAITWEIVEQTLCLSWSESDGPPVSDAPAEGLGSQLICGLVTHELRGVVERDFAPDGFRAKLCVPLGRDGDDAGVCPPAGCRAMPGPGMA